MPSFRGIICQSGFAAIQAEGDVGARAIASIDPRCVEALTGVTKLGWIPAHNMHTLNRAFLELAGETRYIAMWKRHTIGTSELAFFQGLFASAIRIFGKTPVGLTRWIGRAWDVTTRDHGAVTVTNTDDRVFVRLAGCPDGVRHEALALTMKATVIALFEMAGCVDDVDMDTTSLATQGSYTIVGRWSEAALAANDRR